METERRTLHIFTDASVDSQMGVAVGSYWITDDLTMKPRIENIILDSDSVSTMAEYTTAKWVLEKVESSGQSEDYSEILFYTDCENLVNLQSRPLSNLERHRNRDLYLEILDYLNRLQVSLIWVKGHSSLRETLVEKTFKLVDKESRCFLRKLIKIRKSERLDRL